MLYTRRKHYATNEKSQSLKKKQHLKLVELENCHGVQPFPGQKQAISSSN